MRRGQIKSFETIAVLMVFFFLLVFGFVFYSRVQISSFESQRNKNNDISAINTALKTASLPELSCVLTSIKKQNCFDLLKLQALSALLADADLETRLSYFRIFGDSTINVTVLNEQGAVMHLDGQPLQFTLYDNPLDRGFTKIHIPIKVFNPLDKSNAFGYIEVTSYAQ